MSQEFNRQWTPDSWKSKPIHQAVQYDNPETFKQAIDKISQLPPLVNHVEVQNLRNKLREVALGKSFLLQGGDCAELFDYCTQSQIENKLKVLLQMSLVLIWGARVPVVRIARMAGQYAKPRSKPTEVIDGVEYPSFRGDNINGYELDQRDPDPERLVKAYFHSAATLNYVRSILSTGFADLHDPSHWNLGHVQNQSLREEYQTVVSQINSSMNFMEVIGAVKANGLTPQEIKAVDIFMSHEALMLDYEGALCRKFIDKDGVTKYYVASGHYLWVGDRTRQLDCAHVEFLRGVVNPIGIKVGPTTVPEELIKILDTLNPNKEIGKISLITRFGANKVETYLPKIIEAVQASGHIVVWVCDPMHGNTESSVNGLKTRHFDNILKELGECLRIHKNHQSKLNGVHFELTGDSVTECIGGSMQLESSDLPSNYQTYCDPRLNYEQSLDMSFMISKYFEKERSGFNTL